MNIQVPLLMAFIIVLISLVIPYIWWFFAGGSEYSFFNWLGFRVHSIEDKTKYFMAFAAIIILLLIPSFVIIPIFVGSEIVTVQFAGAGISAILPAFISAFLQSSLSEEFFFRGFLGKRFINKFGFKIGNTVQAMIFAIIQGALFTILCGIIGGLLMTLVTFLVGGILGWVAEKQSDGSILSGWLFHGSANMIVSLIAMFNIL